jgi:hypothetical protein
MSLLELLPDLLSLSRGDKLRLIQLLAAELAQAEEPIPLEAGKSYPLWSPDQAYEAADALSQALEVAGESN